MEKNDHVYCGPTGRRLRFGSFQGLHPWLYSLVPTGPKARKRVTLFFFATTLFLSSGFLQADEREDRARRNLEQLTEALKNDPTNTRYLFELAQAHQSLKLYDEAIKEYSARIEKKGDREELWFSKYMLGVCHEERGEWNQALYWYLEAFQQNPSRAHPLKRVATYYRIHGENDLAYIFAKHGSRIPHREGELLPESPLHEYQFDEELSIAAFYTRFREEGYAAVNNIILRKNVPWHIKDQAYRNMAFYVQPLKNTRLQPLEIAMPLIQAGMDERYHPMNPSIRKTEEGYEVICRGVNYTQTGAKIFNTIDYNGIYRSRNFLLQYDRNFKLLQQQEIVDNLQRERVRTCIVEGLEDCRPLQLAQGLWFTCTTSDTNPTGQRQISLCKVRDREVGNTAHLEKLIPLKGPDPNRCEKNWLPFVKEGSFHAIYCFDPLTIFKINSESGECETILRSFAAYDFSHFRGSAAPIEFDGGYLVLVHEVIHLPDSSRYYLHRFLYLDQNYAVAKLSKPFIFQHLGVEFCCSMTLDHSATDLIMAIGIEDREAYFCSVDLETVRSLLNPIK